MFESGMNSLRFSANKVVAGACGATFFFGKGEDDEGATLPNCLTRIGNPVNCSRNYYGLDWMPVAHAAWPQTIVAF
jgi:hypothetical protein